MTRSSDARTRIDFQVDRDDLARTRFVSRAPAAALESGQVLFRVDRFALTSNNISYAVAGDMLDYWGFFPGEQRWGRIPAMGFGDVIESRNPDVAVGTRCFGFFPMSTHLVIDAKANPAGMVDQAEHRRKHAPVYRGYNASDADPFYDANREDQILLLRGLFMTSFLVDDFMDDHDFFGARVALVTSASSKTSIALAFLLSARRQGRVVGLTSARNRAFVEALGCYDEVRLYEEVEELGVEPAIVVDMAGDGDVMNRIHHHFKAELKSSCIVGATHREAAARASDLPGARPEFFFAPSQMQKRSEEWGPGGLQRRLGDAWQRFVTASDAWLHVERGQGQKALERVYLEVLAGRAQPQQGHVLSLHEEG